MSSNLSCQFHLIRAVSQNDGLARKAARDRTLAAINLFNNEEPKALFNKVWFSSPEQCLTKKTIGQKNEGYAFNPFCYGWSVEMLIQAIMRVTWRSLASSFLLFFTLKFKVINRSISLIRNRLWLWMGFFFRNESHTTRQRNRHSNDN